MIDKIKLLNEILENNPELEDKKESVEKLINVLIDNNPDIKADNEFKKNLKSRLDTIIWMEDKSIRKLSIFTAIIQTLSLAFLFGWFYYSLWMIDFFNKNDDNINQLQKIEQEDDTKNLKINKIAQNNNIEDTQITDLLWWLNFENNFKQEKNLIEPMTLRVNIDTSFDSNIPTEDNMILEENINNLEQKISFEEFCLDNMWDLINISDLKICIVEGEQCTEENYNNDVCNFTQIE